MSCGTKRSFPASAGEHSTYADVSGLQHLFWKDFFMQPWSKVTVRESDKPVVVHHLRDVVSFRNAIAPIKRSACPILLERSIVAFCSPPL